MVAAGEEVAEFVGEENGHESGGERQACQKTGGIFVKEREGVEELVPGNGLIVGESSGELSARGKTSAEGEEKKHHGQDERLARGPRKDRDIKSGSEGNLGRISTKTSSAAAATCPCLSASARSASFTNSPRAQFTRRTPFFIFFS